MVERRALLSALAWRESRTARRRLLLYMSSISLGVAALVAIDSFAEQRHRVACTSSRARCSAATSSLTSSAPRTRQALDSRARLAAKRRASPIARVDELRVDGARAAHGRHAPRAGARGRARAIRSTARSSRSRPTPWAQLQRGTQRARRSGAARLARRAGRRHARARHRASFVITGTLVSVPGDVGISAAIGPRVYIPERYLDETELLVFGSRAEYETLFKLPGADRAATFIARFASAHRPRARATCARRGDNESRSHARRSTSCATSSASSGWSRCCSAASASRAACTRSSMRKIDTVAILRCLGATSWQVLAIYVAAGGGDGIRRRARSARARRRHPVRCCRSRSQDFLPVDVDVHLAPTAIRTRACSSASGSRSSSRCGRSSRCAACRRSRRCAASRTPTRSAARASIRCVSLVVAAIVGERRCALGITRADAVQRGLGFSVAIGVAVGCSGAAPRCCRAPARRAAAPVVAVRAAPGHREPVSARQPDARRGARARLRRVSHEHAVPGAAQPAAHARRHGSAMRARTSSSSTCRTIRRAGIDSIVRAQRLRARRQRTPIVPMRIAAINGAPAAQLHRGDADAADGAAQRARAVGAASRVPLDVPRLARRRRSRSSPGNGSRAAARRRSGEVSLDASVARELRLEARRHDHVGRAGRARPDARDELARGELGALRAELLRRVRARALEKAPKQFVDARRVRGRDRGRAPAARRRDAVPERRRASTSRSSSRR